MDERVRIRNNLEEINLPTGFRKYEIRMSKFETNPKPEFSNDRNRCDKNSRSFLVFDNLFRIDLQTTVFFASNLKDPTAPGSALSIQL
jgi:hypothetical protein